MKIQEITDKNLWENFISEYSPQSFFQSWSWGEVVKKEQKLFRLGIYDGNILVGIAQVNKVTARRGNFLHIRHGPIFSGWDRQYLDFLIDYLKKLVKTENAGFIRISPLIDNTEENKNLFKCRGFNNAPIHAMDGEYCWVLDIAKSEEELLAGMRKTTRYLIRQAQKLGIEIVKNKNIKDLDEFLSLYKDTAIRQHFVEHKGIKEEFSQLLTDDQILLFKGYFGGKLISAALIIFYNTQAIYHHSASVEQKIPVNYILQWEAIKEAKRRKMKHYNFWGIAPVAKSVHPWSGLTTFKQGFGGEAVEYLHAQDLPCSLSYCTTYMIEWLRKVKKGY